MLLIMLGSRKIEKLHEKISENQAESYDSLMNLTNDMSMNSFVSSSSQKMTKASEKQRQNISLLSGGPNQMGYRDRNIPIGMYVHTCRYIFVCTYSPMYIFQYMY
jgi:hypothetical protein